MKTILLVSIALWSGVSSAQVKDRVLGWTTDCLVHDDQGLISTVTFGFNSYKMHIQVFEDKTCFNSKFALQLDGNISHSKDDKSMLAFNHNLKSVQLLLSRHEAVEEYNEERTCDVKDWELGVFHDVSGKNCVGFTMPKINTKFFDAAKSGDQYAFSWFPSFEFNPDASDRPQKIPASSSLFWPISEKKFNRVARDIKIYDEKLKVKKAWFSGEGKNVKDKTWVKEALSIMSGLFSYGSADGHGAEYSPAEERKMQNHVQKRSRELEKESTKLMKQILDAQGWITAKDFGEKSEADAFSIISNSRDVSFRKQVLKKLETMVENAKVDPVQFANMHDLLAASNDNPSKRVAQRYGTQGFCQGANWQPYKIEDPKNLDQRRMKLGLSPMQEQVEQMSGLCKEALGIDDDLKLNLKQ